MTAPETRASLLLRLRNHEDSAAWEEFVRLYHPVITRVAMHRGMQQAEKRLVKLRSELEVLEDKVTQQAEIVRTSSDRAQEIEALRALLQERFALRGDEQAARVKKAVVKLQLVQLRQMMRAKTREVIIAQEVAELVSPD